MDQPISAYFYSENDAESALASLRKLRTSNLLVEEIPQENNNSPVLFFNDAMNNSDDVVFFNNQEEQRPTYLLQGKVNASQYQAAMEIIQSNEGQQGRV